MRMPRPVTALAGTLALLAGGLAGASVLTGPAAGGAPAALTAARAALAATVGAGYWRTSGNQILDAAGNPVRIAGINWYGFETPDEIVHGLWAQDYHTIVNDIAALGYNTIRIPFSNQMVETPIVPQNISFYNTGPINTDLKGLNSLQDLDKIIAYAGQVGLKVILDDHRSEAGESAEGNGLWYTSAYPTSAWVSDWVTMARRYAGNPTVIGFDLRNEPHSPGPTYGQGATWGTGDPTTDVRLAYEQAGNAILAVNPSALIFCEGDSQNPTASGTYNSTWWGGDLAMAGQYPVTLNSPGHVVYSAHDYGPNLFQQTWFNSSTTPASLDAVWNANWGYLYSQGTAPVWVGEFGTGNNASDVQSSAAGSQGQWFQSLVGYLAANKWMGWTYWALNGEDSYDLLDGSYDPAPVSSAKQSLLASIEFPLSGTSTGSPSPSPSPSGSPTGSPSPSGSPTGSPSPSPTATGGRVSCTAAYSLTSSWPGGFQAQIVLTNTGTSPVSPWSLTFTFGGDQKISSLWNGVATQSGTQVTVKNAAYDATIAPSASVTLGFTGTYSSSNAAPTGFALNGTSCAL